MLFISVLIVYLKIGICFQFLTVPLFRNVTLKCLTEIGAISLAAFPQYETAVREMFKGTIDQLKQVFCRYFNFERFFGVSYRTLLDASFGHGYPVGLWQRRR